MISVYDNKAIESSSVVYMFHKGFITVLLWSTDEDVKSTFNIFIIYKSYRGIKKYWN